MSHPDPKIAAEMEQAWAERASRLHAAETSLRHLEATSASNSCRNAAYYEVERASEALSDAGWDAYQTWKSAPAQAEEGRAR